MEVTLALADVHARLNGSKRELATVEADISSETQRNEELSTAVLRSTVNGRIWEMLTAPGEHVNAGQDLLEIARLQQRSCHCERRRDRLSKIAIGQRAMFKPRDGGAELQGWVAVSWSSLP